MAEALFVPEGELLLPTELSRGPWSAEDLHGGPVAALLGRGAEGCEGDPSMAVVRLTVELVRPVKLDPLRCEARLARPGRRIQLVEVSLRQGGAEVARAVALRIRRRKVQLPPTVPPQDPVPFVGPEEALDSSLVPRGEGGGPPPDLPAFHSEGAELRFADGFFGVPGPARVWVRLRHPVVEGEEPSPLQRAAAAADFGNGVSSTLPYGDWLFINPDLTVYLSRPPAGEWIGVDARSYSEGDGIGLAESRLWDRGGPVGRSVQSLLLEPLGER